MLGRLVNEALREAPPTHPWGDTLPLFRTADVRVCNLECVLSDRGRPWSATPKVFHFRTDARNAAVLRAAGLNMVAIANNHVLDYEHDALLEMLESLDRAGIAHAGAGRNLDEAWRPALHTWRGKRIAMCAWTDNEPGWEATPERPGICYVPDNPLAPRAVRLFETVAAARQDADCLIVSCHWGGNWSYHTPEEHSAMGRALVDAGADIVFGHSPHVFRAIEIYRGKPIIYSAGDFIDDYAVDEVERNDESFLFAVDMEGRAVRQLSLYPVMIRQFQANRVCERTGRTISAKMQSLSKEFGTASFWDAAECALRIPVDAAGERAA